MVQYHALGLLYHIRKTDRLAVTKLVTKLTKMSLRSPYAVCLLVSSLVKPPSHIFQLEHLYVPLDSYSRKASGRGRQW